MPDPAHFPHEDDGRPITDPLTPTIYRRGECAEVEPAVPGWSMAVEDLFLPA